jgi:hypothetical protein
MRLSSPVPHKRARIEIIPLIDIMFFLLASFMMVSLSQTPHEGYSGQSAGCSCTSAKHGKGLGSNTSAGRKRGLFRQPNMFRQQCNVVKNAELDPRR